jgi:hypothetical protein
MRLFLPSMLAALLLAGCSKDPAEGSYWTMHVIDDSYEGADGVDLVDIDNDGDADAVVPWEESGVLLLHENPGPARVREPWGHTRIGGGLSVGKIEDARFADFDRDGAVDAVVSATEKGSEQVGVHWLLQPQQAHSESAWQGTWLDPSLKYLYLKVAIGQIDGHGASDIVAGSKAEGKAGGLVWYQASAAPGPDNARQWRSRFIDEIEWVDSLEITDINGDGRDDILLNYWNNLLWYENLAAGTTAQDAGLPRWKKHRISQTTKSYFADCSAGTAVEAGHLLVVGADLSAAGPGDVVAYLVGKNHDAGGRWDGSWLQREIRALEAVPRDPGQDDYKVKGITCGNLDDDPRLDIVISMSGRGHGVFALMNLEDSVTDQTLHLQVIAGAGFNSRKGIKYDNLVLEDLDRDGDLDIITTEENGASGVLGRLLPGLVTRGLGLIWYENPGTAPGA